jgi:outer membrane porin, OprD family
VQIECSPFTEGERNEKHHFQEREFISMICTPGIFGRPRRTILVVMVLFLLAGPGGQIDAQESVLLEYPFPSSVDEDVTPIEVSFRERVFPPVMFPLLKQRLKDAPPFFRDTQLDLNMRSYYFYRDRFDDSVNEAWAFGGALTYKSGWLLDRLGMGAAFYTAQRLYGPKDRDGTLLLKPGQRGYAVVGQIYGKVKLFEDHFLNLYRYEYNTPFINKNDSRMTPNTFEGYTLQGAFGGDDGAPGFQYVGGYITKIKERNADDFIWMSRAAGASVKRGVGMAGGLFTYGKFSVGAFNYYSQDIINIFFTESRYSLPITKDLGALLAVQFTDQRSVGTDLTQGRFSTNQIGVKGEISYGGAILAVGYTHANRGDDLRNPWGSNPSYTAVQVQPFNRAGEQAVISRLVYDFSRVGLEGVSGSVLFVHGWDRIDPVTKNKAPNENEFNADLQWRPSWSFLKGFSARLRYARVHQHQGPKNTLHEYRAILNYDFGLL